MTAVLRTCTWNQHKCDRGRVRRKIGRYGQHEAWHATHIGIRKKMLFSRTCKQGGSKNHNVSSMQPRLRFDGLVTPELLSAEVQFRFSLFGSNYKKRKYLGEIAVELRWRVSSDVTRVGSRAACVANELPVILILLFADAQHEKRNLNSRSLPGYGADQFGEPDCVTRRGRDSASPPLYIVLLLLKEASLLSSGRYLRRGEFISL